LFVFKGKLWPYQEEAAERMVDRGQMLLGMVMGAGKTPTALGAVEALRSEGEVSRCLVVVPASLKYQWKREIEKFTDSSLTVIDGPQKARTDQWRASTRSSYVIVNPETLINDTKMMGTFQCIVVDEATIIKNRTAKRTRLLKRIGKTIQYRFALTGQPIENRPEELFSIMEFVDKDVLGTFESFDRTFIVRDHWGKPLRYRNLDKMNKAMKECMIRKTREDIADQLPAIIHQVIPVPFDTKGAALYRAITKDLLNQIASAIKSGSGSFNLWAHYNDQAGKEAQGQIMSRLTVLRMLCDNPELVSVSANNYDDPDTQEGSAYAAAIKATGKLDGMTSAPKLDACLEYIKDVLDEDPANKVVLFSFFKTNLKLIQKATKEVTDSVLFMGGMSAEDRDRAKERFKNDPNTRLFLSSDAGGYGVDLPMANYLISYDLPWSSGKLEQREARIIRLSSEFPHVTIATFVMQGSIEERQYEMLQHKKSVNEAFIDAKHLDKDMGMQITLDTLTNFLKESTV
jgi:SNF2 family DNA or RNA helicase